MDWSFLLGTVVFGGTLAGMFYLRRQPPTGNRRRVRDRAGRTVRVVELRVRRVARTLLDARNVPQTGRLLRRTVRMSKRTFYEALEFMVTRRLVERVSPYGQPFYMYQLTERGVAEARRYHRESYDRR